MNPQDVCYYDHIREKLNGSQLSKARKFCRLGLIEDVMSPLEYNPFKYHVHPIPGYNTRKYTVQILNGGWHCNCQFHNQTKKICSHIMAVLIWRRTREHEEKP